MLRFCDTLTRHSRMWATQQAIAADGDRFCRACWRPDRSPGRTLDAGRLSIRQPRRKARSQALRRQDAELRRAFVSVLSALSEEPDRAADGVPPARRAGLGSAGHGRARRPRPPRRRPPGRLGRLAGATADRHAVCKCLETQRLPIAFFVKRSTAAAVFAGTRDHSTERE